MISQLIFFVYPKKINKSDLATGTDLVHISILFVVDHTAVIYLAWGTTNDAAELGHDDDLITREVVFLDGLSEDDL